MSHQVTLPDGREVIVTPTGARLLTAMLAHGGWRADVDQIAHPATRERLITTGFLAEFEMQAGVYRLTDDGSHAARQIAEEAA